MEYYNIKKNWKKKIKPHLTNKELNNILVKDFREYMDQRNWKFEFKEGMFPFEFESCDWWTSKRGRHPEYWKCVKHGACHYLARFNLKLAQLIAPDKTWRIISSEFHSTVWDGENTIFEFNFYAFGIPADEAFRLAMSGNSETQMAA